MTLFDTFGAGHQLIRVICPPGANGLVVKHQEAPGYRRYAAVDALDCEEAILHELQARTGTRWEMIPGVILFREKQTGEDRYNADPA